MLLLLPPQRGEYAIVQNVTINDFSAKMLATTAEELYGERAEALAFLEGEAVAAAH
jgi:ubiquinone/menaquinone biosynthesis C-methylase UbiE